MPFPKLDLLAVPKMIAGAMENPGLLIFKSDVLLITRETTFLEKIHVALTIAHEVAHQWFGNSVSIEWWSDMWVKEAFATLFQHLAIDEIFPDWNIFEWFFSRFTRTAFKADFGNGSVLKEIAPGKEHEAFNPLSYSKGATVLLHLQQKLGFEVFRDRIRELISSKAGETIKTEDVLEAFEEKETILPWLEQEGYPIVTVRVVNWQNSNLTIEISQRSSTPSPKLWPLWIQFTSSDKEEKMTLPLESESVRITVTEVDEKTGWVLFNTNATGYFVVNYDPAILTNLLKVIGEMSPLDRQFFYHSAFILAEQCLLPPK